MEHIKKIQFFLVALILLNLSCSNNDPEPSAKENIQNALVNSNWVIDEANSDIAGVSGSPDISTITVSFSKTSAGASFTFGGDITPVIAGGQFDLNAQGLAANPELNVDESLVVNDLLIIASEPIFKISFSTTASSGRAEGIGSYTLSFNAN